MSRSPWRNKHIMDPQGPQVDFELLFRSAPSLFLVLDPAPSFTVLAANDAYLRATRIDREAIVGRGLFEAFPGEGDAGGATANLRGSLQRVLATRAPVLTTIPRYDLPQAESRGGGLGPRFWRAFNSPVLSPDGRLLYIIHRVEDAAPPAAEASAEPPLFDGHPRMDNVDFQLLRSARDRDEAIRKLKQRVTSTVDGLLSLSRVSRSKVIRQRVDLTALSRRIVEELRRREPERGVSVEIAEGLEAFADERLVQVVFANLIGNAWKFTSRTHDAHIEIGQHVLGGEKVFYVNDNGAGFDMACAGKLFTPFVRLHGGSDFEGHGIGLATVKRIVECHDGHVRADARPDRGATISFTFGA